MPRITKADLERENAELKAELEQRRERSRSRKRKAQFVAEPMSAAARRALDVVCRHDRDGVIEEQRATIARQAQEINGLRNGEGPIGPVILATWTPTWGPTLLSEQQTRDILARDETVVSFFKRINKSLHNIQYEMAWGRGYL